MFCHLCFLRKLESSFFCREINIPRFHSPITPISPRHMRINSLEITENISWRKMGPGSELIIFVRSLYRENALLLKMKDLWSLHLAVSIGTKMFFRLLTSKLCGIEKASEISLRPPFCPELRKSAKEWKQVLFGRSMKRMAKSASCWCASQKQ